jgi:hypothetical protein
MLCVVSPLFHKYAFSDELVRVTLAPEHMLVGVLEVMVGTGGVV